MGAVIETPPAGSLVVLDAAPIIYRLENHPALRARFDPIFDAHAAGRIRFVVSAITVAEVVAGPIGRQDEGAAQAYFAMLDSWGVIPLNARLALEVARVRKSLGLKLPDAAIVATAYHVGADAIVTHDRHFSRVKGLRVIA